MNDKLLAIESWLPSKGDCAVVLANGDNLMDESIAVLKGDRTIGVL